MKIALMTHRGAVRAENQDAVCAAGETRTGDMDAPEIREINLKEPVLLAVIDGMGGHKGGAMAAEIVASAMAGGADKAVFGGEPDAGKDEEALSSILTGATKVMASEIQGDQTLSEMGAAVGGVVLREKNALAFNCGDCRVYHLRGGSFERVTRDHSLVQERFEYGELTEEQMRTHPSKNVLTSAVSASWGGEFDLYVKELPLEEGDALLMCSDGVWEAFPSQRLAELIGWDKSLADAAGGLFSALLAANCSDNISFILCRA